MKNIFVKNVVITTTVILLLCVNLILTPTYVLAQIVPDCSRAGISYKDKFPSAEYPHAVGPNGCDLSPDEWTSPFSRLTVDFGPACDKHDRCYFKYGVNPNTCNENFGRDLLRRCEEDLDTVSVPFPGAPNPSYAQDIALCTTLTTGYYTGVQAGVLLEFFESAQKQQKEHDDWVAQNCTIPPSPPQTFCSEPAPSTARRNCHYDCYSNGTTGRWTLVCNAMTPCEDFRGRDSWCPAP